MIKLLDKNLTEIAELNNYIDKEVKLNKSINGIYTLNLTVYPTNISVFNQILPKNIIEVENDYYVIDNISNTKVISARKEITASHIFSELKTKYWENTFSVINPTEWAANARITAGLFYTYLGITYQCTVNHVSTLIFDLTKFNNVSGLNSNYMPNTTPIQVLNKLMAGTGWTVIDEGDIFTATDFNLQKGSVYNNIQNILKTWGGEIKVKKRIISIKTRIGTDKLEELNSLSNVTSLNITEDTSEIINRLYVYGSNGLTIESVNPEKYVEDAVSIGVYGLRTGEITLSDITDPNFLKQRAVEELSSLRLPKKTIDTTAVKFEETYNLGDGIVLKDVEFNQDTLYRIFTISYNPENNKINSINLNRKNISITNILKEVIKKSEEENSKLDDKVDNIASNPQIIQQVIEATQFQVISAESAHIMNAWIANLFVDRLETNTWGRDIRNTSATTDRNFIVIQDQTILLVTQQLNLAETESLLIKNPDQTLSNYVNVYYTAIGGEQAFKYYTITKPHILNPEIPEANNHLYEVKVYKIVSQAIKMGISFNDLGDQEPQVVMGAGDGVTSKSNKLYIVKDTDNVKMYYIDSTGADKENGFLFTRDYVSVKNSNVPAGGGHVANVFWGTVNPAAGLGQNGDIYFKI